MFKTLNFSPHPLLRSGHSQTIFAGLWTSARLPYAAKQHIVPTTDGDRLVLHDDCPDGWCERGTCALLVHGLGGSHRSPYMVRTTAKLTTPGVRTFRLDLRGSGAGYHIATKPGHAGRSEDVAAAVEYIHRCCPSAELVIVGYSLGGSIVLKLLGEWQSRAAKFLARAIAISPPIDLLACSENMSRRSMKFYNRWFVKALVNDANSRRGFVAELAQIDWSHPPRTLFDFDDRVTAPLSGFSGAREYYTQCSALPHLGNIHIPTVLLTAADDPIIPVAMFQGAPLSSQVALHVTAHGGHVGFIGRAGADPDHHWLDWRVVEFVTHTSRHRTEPGE